MGDVILGIVEVTQSYPVQQRRDHGKVCHLWNQSGAELLLCRGTDTIHDGKVQGKGRRSCWHRPVNLTTRMDPHLAHPFQVTRGVPIPFNPVALLVMVPLPNSQGWGR